MVCDLLQQQTIHCSTHFERYPCVDEGQGGRVDAGAVVSPVRLQDLHEYVDLGPRVQLRLDAGLKGLRRQGKVKNLTSLGQLKTASQSVPC